MLFQLPIHHQNKGKEVRFYSAISMHILLCYLLSVCIYLYDLFKYKYTYKYANN